jgi:hypothetical protein
MARSVRQTVHIPRPTRMQILKFALLAVGIWLLSHYVVELWEYRGVRAEEIRWHQAVNQEIARLDALQQWRDYVRSEAYVEKVARESFGLAMPGEHVVRPLVDGSADEGVGSGYVVDERPTWRQWWNRFFSPDNN